MAAASDCSDASSSGKLVGVEARRSPARRAPPGSNGRSRPRRRRPVARRSRRSGAGSRSRARRSPRSVPCRSIGLVVDDQRTAARLTGEHVECAGDDRRPARPGRGPGSANENRCSRRTLVARPSRAHSSDSANRRTSAISSSDSPGPGSGSIPVRAAAAATDAVVGASGRRKCSRSSSAWTSTPRSAALRPPGRATASAPAAVRRPGRALGRAAADRSRPARPGAPRGRAAARSRSSRAAAPAPARRRTGSRSGGTPAATSS